ncbi:MAG: SUMF1/EgtB/PvdO family nonheme iron enzyme [Chloroflexota bacterium]
MAGMIGQEFGRYKILELLGEGGMATVYKAYDTRLEREVALKVIRREAFPPEEMDMLLKRFEREAKMLAKLSHPNIVGVIDYGEQDGSPYLVMVYVPGGTLKQRLGQPMPWREAVKLLLPIAHALEYVHEHNIINRDVKPSNILMTEKGQPMMSDFGLVKLFGEQKGEAKTALTTSGSGIGTPDYMAPEQWTGEASALSDLYSLGVVLYEMITGHRPYTADTPAGILLKQATESLPLPNTYVPDLPPAVESVILKVLAKEPVNRYPDVHTFANELENLLAGREVAASTIKTERLREQMLGRPAPKRPVAGPADRTVAVEDRKKFPFLWVSLGVAALMFIVGGGIWYAIGGATPEPTSTPAPHPSPSATFTLPPPTATLELPTATGEPTDTPHPPSPTSVPAEIVDAKNVPMRLVPAGEFTMGSDDTGDLGVRPAHTVYVDAFYMDTYEVTNERYDACVYAIECRKPLQEGSATHTTYFSNPVFANYPVIFVDWKMAKAYCEWRGARLPTEAEWEKAARGADARLYPWGNDKPDCLFGNFAGCVGDTTPVDQHVKGASIYGIYGLAGNVWEWTSSLFGFYPYDADDGREDPKAVGERVARGGAWNGFGSSGNVRSDARLKLDPAYYGAAVGIRCAISASQVTP